ncbi:MAG: hypothetical protein FD153_813 [Rhodospirillaceae bacterium]|nr:MAG: hypothetical protein FD153_813 [Rhodospirillaceae bacterium]
MVEIAAISLDRLDLIPLEPDPERIITLDPRMVGTEIQFVFVAGRMMNEMIVFRPHGSCPASFSHEASPFLPIASSQFGQ